jgi:cytoskeletal protein CcmA (bactofilin family)
MSLFNRSDKDRSDKPGEKAAEILQPQPAKPTPAPAPQTIDLTAKPAGATPAPTPAPAKAQVVTPPPPKTTPTLAKTGEKMASVISKALKITGELESTEDIQIDGQIEGDVRGVGVKIGQNARVKGTVYGDEVELAGTVEGKIESKKVILAGTARMTGDIWHQDIKIESGAYINGNLKPDMGKPDSRAESKPAAKPAAASASVLTPANKDNAAAAVAH